MTDFAAIDFETANEYSSCVCSVGLVVVRDGVVTDRFYSLIHPEPEYFSWFCQHTGDGGGLRRRRSRRYEADRRIAVSRVCSMHPASEGFTPRFCGPHCRWWRIAVFR